ncbi:MAG: hypothetical protein IT430_10950 [Phycisphaerales bacterium]|nr:hypothetical protein [Phycisphaerales bacterium]
MSTTPSQQHDSGSALDRYLDGLMSAEERSAFEARLAEDAVLAGEIQRQRRIDDGLNRYAQPPAADRVLAAIRAHIETAGYDEARAEQRPPQMKLRLPATWRRFAVAAALLLGIVGIWQIVSVMTGAPEGDYDSGPHRSVMQAYHHTVDSGFKEEWVCSDDAVFAMVFQDAFGQMLSMNLPLPPGVDAKGLNFFNIFSNKTIGVLAVVEDQPVMVFIDRLENEDREPPPQSDSGLRVFRRELGSLVLFEVTPLDAPALVEHLTVPDRLPEPVQPQPEPPQR